MDFRVDKTTVTEGDIVEVIWDCSGAESANLKIDNGYKASVIPLELEGSKRFRLHRSKGKTVLTLRAVVGGKMKESKIKVKIKPLEVTQSETVYSNGKTGFFEGLKYKFRDFRQRFRAGWQQLPPKKQWAIKLLGLILLIPLMFLMGPVLLGIALLLLVVYLLIVIFRR